MNSPRPWFFSALTGNNTYSTKLRIPFPSTSFGAAGAFLSFFWTVSGGSRRSILESGSEADIFPPWRPGTIGFIKCARSLYPILGSCSAASAKIFRWSTPPNWASTPRCSSSNACMRGYISPLSVGLATCFTTSAPAFLESCSVTTELSRKRSIVYSAESW